MYRVHDRFDREDTDIAVIQTAHALVAMLAPAARCVDDVDFVAAIGASGRDMDAL
jgi:hypothetical protein